VPRYNLNIVESGIKYHNLNPLVLKALPEMIAGGMGLAKRHLV